MAGFKTTGLSGAQIPNTEDAIAAELSELDQDDPDLEYVVEPEELALPDDDGTIARPDFDEERNSGFQLADYVDMEGDQATPRVIRNRKPLLIAVAIAATVLALFIVKELATSEPVLPPVKNGAELKQPLENPSGNNPGQIVNPKPPDAPPADDGPGQIIDPDPGLATSPSVKALNRGEQALAGKVPKSLLNEEPAFVRWLQEEINFPVKLNAPSSNLYVNMTILQSSGGVFLSVVDERDQLVTAMVTPWK